LLRNETMVTHTEHADPHTAYQHTTKFTQLTQHANTSRHN